MDSTLNVGPTMGSSVGTTPGLTQSIAPGVSPSKESVLHAGVKKLRFFSQDPIRDPYAQISNAGFTPVGNLKTYGVANMYDRPEPTKLRTLKELYTVPYTTTPFLASINPSVKYIDDESLQLRAPVFQNKKSAIDISQVTTHPQQAFVENPNVSKSMNNFYEQFITINSIGNKDQFFPEGDLDPRQVELGQESFGLNNSRYINRWDIVDPSVVQNVDHIVMNYKTANGMDISLFSCGVSTRNELRNYVETNNC